jgi:hypothetical protein
MAGLTRFYALFVRLAARGWVSLAGAEDWGATVLLALERGGRWILHEG